MNLSMQTKSAKLQTVPPKMISLNSENIPKTDLAASRRLRVLAVTPELPHPLRPNTMAPAARQIESMEKAGADMSVLEITGLPRLKYLQSIPKQRALQSSVELVHAHFGYCGWLARSQFRNPVIVSFMGSDLLGTPDVSGRLSRFSRMMVRANRVLARWVDAVIVKSPEMAEIVAPVPAHVVPNGVDLDKFQPQPMEAARRKLGWSDDCHYVLFPGNPDNPRKGYALAEKVIELAKPGLSTRVELVALRKVDPDLVPVYMNACNAMLMVSLLEGSPNVVKEAMACDLPIVSVPVGDVEILLADVSGTVVCPRDANALAAALVEFLVNPPKVGGRDALRQRGLDIDSVANRIMNIYHEVLNGKSNPS